MGNSGHESRGAIGTVERFSTTHWGLVAAACAQTSAESREALSELCQRYWLPLYTYIRRKGHNINDAEDLTQAFFALLLEKKSFRLADPRVGRFRWYLLGACQHFLADVRDQSLATKRGGRRRIIALDTEAAEGLIRIDPVDDRSPERLFDRQWALTVLNLALAELRRQFIRDGKEQAFEKLCGCLTGDNAASYQSIGAELGITAAAVKIAVHRLKRRYRNLVRDQVAGTLSSPAEIDEEVRHLFEALRD